MRRLGVWEWWLLAVCAQLALFGLFMAFAHDTALFTWIFANPVNAAFWADAAVPPAVADFQGWIYGVLGMVMVGWSAMIAAVVRVPFSKRETWAWHALFWPILIWYFPDTVMSAYHEVWVNVALNTLLAISILLPVAARRSRFRSAT